MPCEWLCWFTLSCFFNIFRPVTEHEFTRIIMKSSSTTCSLDIIPTCVLKLCLEELVPIMTNIISDIRKYYNVPIFALSLRIPNRIVMILTFIVLLVSSITMERSSCSFTDPGVCVWASSSSKNTVCLSSFPRQYCETALLCVSNEILMSLDESQGGIVILLAYSSAFDTVRHDTILQRFSQWFGIQGSALDWFQTYLTSRTHTVAFDRIQ